MAGSVQWAILSCASQSCKTSRWAKWKVTITCSEREAHATQKFIAGKSIVIPDRQFEGSLRQFLERNIFVYDCVIPHGINCSFDYVGFALGTATLLWQEIARDMGKDCKFSFFQWWGFTIVGSSLPFAECVTSSIGLDSHKILCFLHEHVQGSLGWSFYWGFAEFSQTNIATGIVARIRWYKFQSHNNITPIGCWLVKWFTLQWQKRHLSPWVMHTFSAFSVFPKTYPFLQLIPLWLRVIEQFSL